jgi:hypothetical protein
MTNGVNGSTMLVTGVTTSAPTPDASPVGSAAAVPPHTPSDVAATTALVMIWRCRLRIDLSLCLWLRSNWVAS